MPARPPSLLRYTDLPALLHLLKQRKLTLLDPSRWDDSNDSHYIALYKKRRRYKSVLALCFTTGSETYHHWRVFAPGSAGACIQFRGPSLIDEVQRPGMRADLVRYMTFDEYRSTKKVTINELPFLKRFPYEQEQEFRLLYQSTTRDLKSLDVPIDLDLIMQIRLSPWLHTSLAESVRKLIRTIDGCKSIRINHSTLISNDEWKALGDAAV